MERMYAFTDEYGAFGYDLDNPNVSTHFIITAVIVRESDLETYTAGAEAIRKKYFQTGEIKSSKLGPEKHHRRMLILQDISALPMHFLTICILRSFRPRSSEAPLFSMQKKNLTRRFRQRRARLPVSRAGLRSASHSEPSRGFRKRVERFVQDDRKAAAVAYSNPVWAVRADVRADLSASVRPRRGADQFHGRGP